MEGMYHWLTHGVSVRGAWVRRAIAISISIERIRGVKVGIPPQQLLCRCRICNQGERTG